MKDFLAGDNEAELSDSEIDQLMFAKHEFHGQIPSATGAARLLKTFKETNAAHEAKALRQKQRGEVPHSRFTRPASFIPYPHGEDVADNLHLAPCFAVSNTGAIVIYELRNGSAAFESIASYRDEGLSNMNKGATSDADIGKSVLTGKSVTTLVRLAGICQAIEEATNALHKFRGESPAQGTSGVVSLILQVCAERNEAASSPGASEVRRFACNTDLDSSVPAACFV